MAAQRKRHLGIDFYSVTDDDAVAPLLLKFFMIFENSLLDWMIWSISRGHERPVRLHPDAGSLIKEETEDGANGSNKRSRR